MLMTKAIKDTMLKNEREGRGLGIRGHVKPVLKLFCSWGAATWLLTELSPEGRAFGLCDLGIGYPELGYVDMREVLKVTGPLGLKIERDTSFRANKTLAEYAAQARDNHRIIA